MAIKDWIYGALIAAVLSWGAYEHHHLIALGEAKDQAKVAVVAAKAEKQVAAGTVAAQTTESSNAKTYDQTVAPATAVGSVGIVCHHENASSRRLPEAPAVAAPGTDRSASDSTTGPSYDPSGAALERALRADAQIAYLQARVHELETQMENAP